MNKSHRLKMRKDAPPVKLFEWVLDEQNLFRAQKRFEPKSHSLSLFELSSQKHHTQHKLQLDATKTFKHSKIMNEITIMAISFLSFNHCVPLMCKDAWLTYLASVAEETARTIRCSLTLTQICSTWRKWKKSSQILKNSLWFSSNTLILKQSESLWYYKSALVWKSFFFQFISTILTLFKCSLFPAPDVSVTRLCPGHTFKSQGTSEQHDTTKGQRSHTSIHTHKIRFSPIT